MSPLRWYQRAGAGRNAWKPTLLLPSERQVPKTLWVHRLIVLVGVAIDLFRRLFRRDFRRSAPRKILFASRYHLGDFLMSVPGLALAQASLPSGVSTTVVLQKRYIGQISLEGIVDGAITEIDETLPFWRQVQLWIAKMRAGQYDAVVFHRITRPDFPSVLAAFLLDIPYRVGGADKGVSGLLTDLYCPAHRVHVVDYHLELVRAWLNLPGDAGEKRWPSLVDGPSAVPAYDVVIAPFAQHTKIWPLESWHQLLAHLSRPELGLRIALSATPAFARESAEIVKNFPAVEDLSETTNTLADLFATVRRARLLIAVDTGIRHVAAAVGTRCVTLGQGREHIALLGQYVPTERYLMRMVPCAPCGAEPCPLVEGHLKCIRGISVAETLETIEQLAPEILRPANLRAVS